MALTSDDRAAIRQVLARYCRGIDRLDAELVAEAYWPDGYDDHGPYKGGAPGFVEWIIPAMDAMYASTNHTLGQSYFEVAGDRAVVETQFTAFRQGKGGHMPPFTMLGGRYVDLLERRLGEWRILNRVVMYDWEAEATARPLNFEHQQASHSRDDPSYRMFAMLDAVDPASGEHG